MNITKKKVFISIVISAVVSVLLIVLPAIHPIGQHANHLFSFGFYISLVALLSVELINFITTLFSERGGKIFSIIVNISYILIALALLIGNLVIVGIDILIFGFAIAMLLSAVAIVIIIYPHKVV